MPPEKCYNDCTLQTEEEVGRCCHLKEFPHVSGECATLEEAKWLGSTKGDTITIKSSDDRVLIKMYCLQGTVTMAS